MRVSPTNFWNNKIEIKWNSWFLKQFWQAILWKFFFSLIVGVVGVCWDHPIPIQTVKISLFKLSKFSFSNCQNSHFQTVKIFLIKLSKFSLSNCQNFPFPNCQNSHFQTVKISLFKLSKFSFSNCQNSHSQTVKIQPVQLNSHLPKKTNKKKSKNDFPMVFFQIQITAKIFKRRVKKIKIP
jgi:hypothetical protein